MPLKVHVGGAAKDPVRATVRVAGANKTVRRIEVYDDDEWHVGHSFLAPLTLVIAPDSVSVSGSGKPLITQTVTATPSGGLAPYFYAWEKVSGSASISIQSPSSASTRFSMPPSSGGFYPASFRCTSTDSAGQTASATCVADFFFN